MLLRVPFGLALTFYLFMSLLTNLIFCKIPVMGETVQVDRGIYIHIFKD